MNMLLLILIVLAYIAIGVAISAITTDDVLAVIVLFWVPIMIYDLGKEFANFVIYLIEKIQEKMGE